MILNPTSQLLVAIFNAKIDPSGPIAIPINLDFTAATQYTIDGSQILHLGFSDFVQTLYIDTTGASGSLTVTSRGTQQQITAQKNTQGYYPVLSQTPWVFDFSGPSVNSVVQVILFNNPIAPATWPTA